jgi:hypothetical protein
VIDLPSNAYWVKLWNFRATDITPPRYVTASSAALSSNIVCNPNDNNVYTTCSQDNTSGGADFGTSISAATATVLASRVAALVSGAGNANACYNVSKASWVSGAETWVPSSAAFGDPSNGGLSASQMNSLPWEVHQASGVDVVCQGADTRWRAHDGAANCGAANNGNILTNAAAPKDSQIQTATLVANDANYTDQLFVTTDPAVDDAQMRNQSSAVSYYRPITYRAKSDCNAASRVLCPANKEIHWDVNVKEVGNANSADIYPLCVLQFYD